MISSYEWRALFGLFILLFIYCLYSSIFCDVLILGGSKSSGTHISERHLGTSFELFLWSGMASNESEKLIFPGFAFTFCRKGDLGPKIRFFFFQKTPEIG